MTSRLVQLLGTWRPGEHVAASLADRIRALVLDGRLTVGDRLPSERVLASELRRSRATITAAYDRLSQGGYVSRVHGGGTHVTLPHRSAAPIDASEAQVDFTIASMGSTPGLHAATMRALDRLAELRGTSGYTLTGLPELRDRIAAAFTARGLPTVAEEIIVTSGAMHALTLVMAAFAKPGRTALVEQPTFPHPMETLRRHGHRLLPTPVTTDGRDLAHMTEQLLSASPHLAYLIPDFHNPTGASLTDAERSQIAAAAASARTMVIADETCALLDIDRGFTPLPLAAHGPAITLGSLSKLAWGGMRIGWIRASRHQIDRIVAARSSVDLGTAVLEQCIAIELFDELPALVGHAVTRLRAGRAAVAAGLSALPGVTMPDVHGGLSAWVDLGEPISTSLALAARGHGLQIPAGPRFATGPVLERFLRIPITLEPEVTADGLSRLAAAWEDVHAGVVRGTLEESTLV